MTDSFWTELLDLCRKHGVTELYSTSPTGRPGRVTLTYDNAAQCGEFIISNVGVSTTKPDNVKLAGTSLHYVYMDNVHIQAVEKPSLRDILHAWISKFSKRTGPSS